MLSSIKGTVLETFLSVRRKSYPSPAGLLHIEGHPDHLLSCMCMVLAICITGHWYEFGGGAVISLSMALATNMIIKFDRVMEAEDAEGCEGRDPRLVHINLMKEKGRRGR